MITSHNQPKTKIAIVDDHEVFRQGIAALFNNDDDFEIVFQASNGIDFIDKNQNETVDIVLMDLEMPELNGIETLERMVQQNLTTKVIILSSHQEEKFIVHLMELGASGYLIKEASFDDIRLALSSVRDTGYYFSEYVSKMMLHGLLNKNRVKPNFKNINTLSDRELDVLKLICQELTTAEIAEKLFISPRTVDGHRNHIMEKTGARNTAGMVVFALKNKLVSI